MYNLSASPNEIPDSALTVLFLVYPGISLLDLAGPLQAITWARDQKTKQLGYRTEIVSLDGGSIPTDTLVSVDTTPVSSWAGKETDTLIVVGGDGVYAAIRDKLFQKSVALLAAHSRRVCSVCSGAIALAAAGLLDGKRAVTHWEDADALETMFPSVTVETDPIYIKEKDIWTSAGVTAGTDMALALIAEDLGTAAALDRAQALVTYMVRPGGQSQFSPVLERQKIHSSKRFDDLHKWIQENLHLDLKVEALAAKENMSVRSFYRSYTELMGVTPAKTVESIRMEAAREHLETTKVGIKSIATKCGFGDEERMRRAFVRLLGIPPKDYRKRFGFAESLA